jgi:hypothetical protein
MHQDGQFMNGIEQDLERTVVELQQLDRVISPRGVIVCSNVNDNLLEQLPWRLALGGPAMVSESGKVRGSARADLRQRRACLVNAIDY